MPRSTPTPELAKAVVNCTLRLPAIFAATWNIDRVIKALEVKMISEGIVEEWYKSYWLKGALFLILNENMETRLEDYILRYDRYLGLSYEKID